MARDVEIPFDPSTDKVFCSFCGQQCVEGGHMVSTFMMCPTHGEFTIAPVVIKRGDNWVISTDQTTADMWKTCKLLSERASGES